jgi:hypothetical protein
MNREILAACVAAVLIALLYCWQWRYDFSTLDKGVVIQVDRWNGCFESFYPDGERFGGTC